MLHQREGFWETRIEPQWSRAWLFDHSRKVVHTRGVLGVQFNPYMHGGDPGVMVSLGHSGRFDLALLVEEASELVELLAAAIGEANGADNSTLVRTFEGYWPLRTVPRWSSAYMYTRTQMMRAQGVLGVRFDAGLCDGAPGVVVAMAESTGGMNLQVSVAEAMELVELLAAAISDANGVEQPCVDVTLDECTWACCKAVR